MFFMPIFTGFVKSHIDEDINNKINNIQSICGTEGFKIYSKKGKTN